MEYYKYFKYVISLGKRGNSTIVYDDIINKMLLGIMDDDINWIYNNKDTLKKYIPDLNADKMLTQFSKIKILLQKIFFSQSRKTKSSLMNFVEKIDNIKNTVVSQNILSENKITGKMWHDDENIHQYFINCIKEHENEGYIEVRKSDIKRISDGKTISAAYITEYMLAYDSLVFSLLSNDNNRVRELYRPYYFELEIQNQDVLDKIRQYYSDLEIQNETFSDEIRQYYADYENEYIFLKCKLENIQENKQQNKSKNRPENITENESENEADAVMIIGTSPIRHFDKKIEITGNPSVDEIKKIDEVYSQKLNDLKPSTAADIKNLIGPVIGSARFKNVKIYKVGNANCTYLYADDDENHCRLLYDIGICRKKAHSTRVSKSIVPYVNSIRAFVHFKPDIIVISHWDSDHYIGYVYTSNDIFNCPWISPDLKYAKMNAKRLASYLAGIKCLNVIDSDREEEIKVNDELVLYKGLVKDKDISKINCTGIAIKIYNTASGRSTMLMGDVPYISLPAASDFKKENPYDTLIVPHHGSKMDFSPLKAISKKGIAVICSDGKQVKTKKGLIDNPDSAHVNKLKCCYDDVVITESFVSSSKKIKL